MTFSAIEGDQVVKPAAIALMAARTELQGRAFGQWVPTSTPHVLVARYGPRDGGTDSVLVAWSDDAAVPMVLKGGGGKADLTDQYGRSRTLAVGNNGTLVTLTGSVQYLSIPAGSDLALSPLETWGPDVALASAGATATATSHNPLNVEVNAIDGEGAANGQGDFRSSSAWASAPGDAEPALTVTFSGRTALDRVVYATGGLGSVQSGIRDTDVDVLVSDGTWQRVGQVRNAFAQRTSTVTFPVVTASAVRLTVRSVNLGGYNGGAAPWFWPTDTSSLSDGTQPWYGPAIVREIEAYGPGNLTNPTDPGAPAPLTPSDPPAPSVATPPTNRPPTVPAAPAPTLLSTKISSPGSVTVTAGRTVVRSTRLTTASGSTLGGQPVRLLVRPHGSGAWAVFRSATTDRTGVARFSLVVSRNTDLRVAYTGSRQLRASSSTVSTLYTRRAVSVTSSYTTVHRGTTVRLTGRVSPASTGKVLVQRLVAGTWRTLTTAALSNGAYRASYRLTRAGAYTVRIVRLADATTATSTSRVLRLRAM